MHNEQAKNRGGTCLLSLVLVVVTRSHVLLLGRLAFCSLQD